MAGLPINIAALIDSEKTIDIDHGWDSKPNDKYLTILAPLAVSEVTIGGFDLRLKISKTFVARDAFGQLEYALHGRRTAVGLWRLEWRPFSIHDNGAFPPEFAWASFAQVSHEHRFEDNYIPNEHRMRAGNLPAVRGLTPDPGTLSDFLALCGERFRIKDIARLRVPSVTPDLFWVKDE